MQNQSQKKKRSWGLLSEDLGKAKLLMWISLLLCGVISMIVMCCGCSYINRKLGLQDDNFGEELAEEIIEMKTGLDVDLTPSSPERK